MKRKIRLRSIIIVFTIILFSVFIFLFYQSLRITNIYVIGNNILSENEILEETNLYDYPKISKVNKKTIENELIKNPLINKVNIDISIFGKLKITIEENKILYQDKNGKYMLSNKELVSLNRKIVGIPTLMNDCDEVKDKFIEKLLLIEDDILKRISEIEYKKTDLDKERFLFLMTDGNYVYVTLSKISLINSYNEIYPTLEENKGILYLDSGNHFEIKKSNKENEKE